MPRFELRQSTRHITSYAGLILVGQCLEAARLELLDKQFPAPEGQMPTSDIVKSYVGLLALGKGDFDAIEPFRNDRFFREALGIGKVPSSAWMRQRKEKRDFRLVVRLIERTIDPKGQVLLFPEYRLEGWWASLGAKPEKVIELYREHATHEQFHSEIKSDLDLECLPSGQVRLQRPRAAPGDAGLQLPAPRRPDRPGSA